MIVPGLGVGHEAAAAEDAAQLADHAHHVGRREGHVEVEPAGLDALDEVLAADLVRAGAQRLLGLLALGEDDDPHRLPMPCGSTTVPRTIWSAWRGSTPRRMCASTDGSKLTLAVSRSRSMAASGS